MPGRTHSAARLALAFALVGAPPHTASRIAPTDIFDVYAVGVRVAELAVTDDGGSRSYTIRKKDVASNQWRPAVTASEIAVARDTAFSLWRRNLAASMASLRAIHWGGLRAVGWPDASTIYVRHTDRREVVNGRTVSAARWVQRDASEPLDFVSGDDDRLIAAVDVSHDVVLVRRGYERFTTVMELLAIDHVQLAMPAGAEDRARHFYRDVLGLREIAKPTTVAARGGVWCAMPVFNSISAWTPISGQPARLIPLCASTPWRSSQQHAGQPAINRNSTRPFRASAGSTWRIRSATAWSS